MSKNDPLEIVGLMDNDKIRWKKIPCKCDHSDPEKEYPIADCKHCRFQECEDSMPRKCYTINEPNIDKETGERKDDKIVKREITKITIVRGKKYDDIIGWVS